MLSGVLGLLSQLLCRAGEPQGRMFCPRRGAWLGPRLRCLLIAAGGGEPRLPGSHPAAWMNVSLAWGKRNNNNKKKLTALLVPCLLPAAL